MNSIFIDPNKKTRAVFLSPNKNFSDYRYTRDIYEEKQSEEKQSIIKPQQNFDQGVKLGNNEVARKNPTLILSNDSNKYFYSSQDHVKTLRKAFDLEPKTFNNAIKLTAQNKKFHGAVQKNDFLKKK